MSKIGDVAQFSEEGSYGVSINGRELLVVKNQGDFFVYENRCPHTNETLNPTGGSVATDDGLLLQCQRHAAQFVPQTGECVGGPCLGEQLEPVPFTLAPDALYLD
jgi:nitrite reductase/ring-hydroxylating ferredoxin subunit